MITERDKRLENMRVDANTYRGMFPFSDVEWLLDEIKRLDNELERIRDDAVQEGIERDLNT